MSEPSKHLPLTREQRNEVHAALRQVAAAPISSLADLERDPNLRVYVAAFDGTWNDRDNLRDDANPTHVDRLEAELSKHYDGQRMDGAYYSGVGTRTNVVLQYLDGATGRGTAERAEQAYTDFQAKASEWLAEDPDAKIHVHTMGFSRGAASARHFLNLVDERGVGVGEYSNVQVDYKVDSRSPTGFEAVTERRYAEYAVAPGGVSSSAILLDTVATGQTDNLKLSVPASTRFIAHVISLDEERYAFPLAATKAGEQREIIDFRNVEFTLPGAHSDIGGSYEGGMRDISAYMMDSLSHRLGLPVDKPALADSAVADAYTHDSRGATTRLLQSLFGRDDERRSLAFAAEQAPQLNGTVTLERVHGVPVSELVENLPLELRETLFSSKAEYRLSVALNEKGEVEWSTSHPDRIKFDKDASFWELDDKAILPLDSYMVDYLGREGPYELRVTDVQSLAPDGKQICVAHDADRPLSEVLAEAMSTQEWASAWTDKQVPNSAPCEEDTLLGESKSGAELELM